MTFHFYHHVNFEPICVRETSSEREKPQPLSVCCDQRVLDSIQDTSFKSSLSKSVTF